MTYAVTTVVTQVSGLDLQSFEDCIQFGETFSSKNRSGKLQKNRDGFHESMNDSHDVCYDIECNEENQLD